MTDTAYVIRFDFPADPNAGAMASTIYAGWAGDTLGFAPTIDTAARFKTEAIAKRTLENSYGENMQEVGSVVTA